MQGPEFSRISELILDEHFPPLCSLIASLDRRLGLWRLEEVCNSTGITYVLNLQVTIPSSGIIDFFFVAF